MSGIGEYGLLGSAGWLAALGFPEAEAAAIQAKAERVEAEADLKVADSQLVRIQAESHLSKSQLVRRERLS